MQSRRKRKTLILSILVVGLFVIWTVVPIYMLISQSVKPESIMFADPPKLFYQLIFDHFCAGICPQRYFRQHDKQRDCFCQYHGALRGAGSFMRLLPGTDQNSGLQVYCDVWLF